MTEQTNKADVYPPGSRLLLNCGTEHVPCLYEGVVVEWSAKGHVKLRLADNRLSWYAKLDTVIEVLPRLDCGKVPIRSDVGYLLLTRTEAGK